MFTIQYATALLARKRVLWHLLFWFAYACFQFRNYYVTIEYYDVKYLEFMLITRVPFVLVTYLTIWLYKKLIENTYYISYIVSGMVIWSGLLALIVAFQKYYLRDIEEIAQTKGLDIFFSQLPTYIVLFILITMCKYFKNNFIQAYQEREQKQLQLDTELQHLKAQISPHFLFNTMNNFYGLAVEQSAKLPALMVGLSELLRYSLYETNSATVALRDEVKYLKNYIELEKIRLEETLDFEFTTNVTEANALQIIPLLLVIFVENAFKHAKNVKTDVMRVKISLLVADDNVLVFEVKNNCLQELDHVDYTSKGIGLENARKRLDAFYPGNQHHLVIEKSDFEFRVQLTIHLATRQ